MDLQNKNILITGGTGFLGANLVHYLIEKRRIPESHLCVFFLEGTSSEAIRDFEEITIIPGNILNKTDLERACDNIDLIFHTVGNTSFDPRAKKTQWLVNVEGTRNLLEIMRENENIEKLCYTSTVNTLGCPRPCWEFGNNRDQ
ncbi:MAG: NAD-dependent epimerase/dehydratase family protein [Promethearchaeia archaeon]